MNSMYRGFTIHLWVDDDTGHARMLCGEKGPERQYVDVNSDRCDPTTKPRSRRMAEWQVSGLSLPGSLREQLLAAARWWIDAPDEFDCAVELTAEFRGLLLRHRDREQATNSGHHGNQEER